MWSDKTNQILLGFAYFLCIIISALSLILGATIVFALVRAWILNNVSDSVLGMILGIACGCCFIYLGVEGVVSLFKEPLNKIWRKE